MENNMKIVYKAIIIALMATLLGGASYAQKNESTFSDRIFFDATGTALIPSSASSAFGGGAGIGLAFRDLNLLLRPQVLMLDPAGSAKVVINPVLQLEGKFKLMPNLLTLLPYANIGVFMVKLTRADGTLSSNVPAFYTEVGAGAEIHLTHEISAIPRIGFAYCKAVELPDSLNLSGPVVSLTLRYALGRTTSLDY
jgi:hypothetical protein